MGVCQFGEWKLIGREWKNDMLRIMLPGDNHAYLGFWDRRQRLDRWYINLEREHERTKYGIDFVDHFLDIVIRPDTNEWRWKDEEELDHAVSRGPDDPTAGGANQGGRVSRSEEVGGWHYAFPSRVGILET